VIDGSHAINPDKAATLTLWSGEDTRMYSDRISIAGRGVILIGF